MSGFVPTDLVEVRAWGERVGAVAHDPGSGAYVFEYTPEWAAGPVELAPLHMANRTGVFVFPDLDPGTWKRLPPLLADSLPDDFGNALVDAWMVGRGIDRNLITPLDRLAYTADRGMGALTFHPPLFEGPEARTAVALADLVIAARSVLSGDLAGDGPAQDAFAQLIQVGSSAGGARAKAVIAYNPATGQIRSGQFDAPDGFGHWLIKLDGVSGGTDRGAALGNTSGFGRVEYAYHLMALEAGVTMTACHLLLEGDRAHFMTERFDRTVTGERLHVLSLCALAHLSFRQPGAHSYEQWFATIDELGLGRDARAEAFRRAVFNICAVNRDDHTKNVAFCCTPDGRWSLAPAFDVTHSYRVDSNWVARHQMSMNGRTEHHRLDDLVTVGDRYAIPGYRTIISDVLAAVDRWDHFAVEAGVDDIHSARIRSDITTFRPT